ncbi:MAG: hypothetical protein ACI9SC_002899 [Gammaproteobacteria bacterium]|jgi:hypothetical protein
MKLINTNLNVVFAWLTALLIATSIPAQADETGFTLEDAIKHQIFVELKSNVEDLYRNGNLLVPGVDTSAAARVANGDVIGGFALPISVNGNKVMKNRAVENIN